MASHIWADRDDDQTARYTTAVAIDKDKNSQVAVRWTIDHLLKHNPNLILIHVRVRNLQHHGSMNDAGPESYREPPESETQQLYLPYRGFCARKGVQVREVVLDDVDVSKAIVDYINNNYVINVVVGASTRNAFTRKFKNVDVPTNVTKSAPDFCSVYVIAKGKVMNYRSANRSMQNTAAPPRHPSSPMGLPPQLPSDYSDSDDSGSTRYGRGNWRTGRPEVRSFDRNTDYMKSPGRDRPLSTARSAPFNLSMDLDLPTRTPRPSNFRGSISDDVDFTGALGFGSCDMTTDNLEFSMALESPRVSTSSAHPSRELEVEMMRLRLELKQTMDMYSSACKEALSAKQKAQELHLWKMEEVRRFEEARLAEEAALAMAEIEKSKCKAAMEAAEAAQRVAEMEAQMRRNAESKARREAAEKKRVLNAFGRNNDSRYRKYSIEELEAATNRFSDSLKIGEGGYGPVYGATLDHTSVAIKVLRPDAAQGRKQFQQEVEVLSNIRHPNMVLLLGACPEYGCLVYEYMDNGSLEDRLFRRGNTPTLSWRTRYKIAADIATGLLFLHQTKPEPLVHRDLKPANILLDRNYVCKISDVGLARLVPPSIADTVTQYRLTSTAGTFCYIDPEYQQTGMLGVKSDIYSLGIMLLQIITAKPPMGLTHLVEKSIEKGTFAEMLDQTVSDWPMEETLSYAKLALKCAELRRKDRPDLGSVILPDLNRLRHLKVDEANRSSSISHGSHSYYNMNSVSKCNNEEHY